MLGSKAYPGPFLLAFGITYVLSVVYVEFLLSPLLAWLKGMLTSRATPGTKGEVDEEKAVKAV